MMLTPLFVACLGLLSSDDLPVVTVSSDDTAITKSCRIEIPSGLVLVDANRDGVLHVAASGIVLEFAPDAILRGAAPSTLPDAYEGYGIRIEGQRNVTIRGGRISGFRAAIWATDAPGLTIENIDASDGRRMHLRSDPQVEANEDWLYPHHNDGHEWLKNYGVAIYVERSDGLTVRNCRVWHSQNALCLDRVNAARIYDNDFSFNSGWGIALWRSGGNIITRNALDFCIRGYSHNVYNRGQDSAGLLFFEQDSDNVVAENSVTHGGDGFFGWAGQEAMDRSARSTSAPAPAGEPPATMASSAPTSAPAGLGCNRNLLIRNDFSYAAAHGIELTFSFDNRFLANRLVGNAICGVWAGYSQGTLIAGNEIAENGGAGYGLERGGVNIDSSRRNRILHNTFSRNACGVHLWWRTQQQPDRVGWAAANLPDWEGNLIAGNEFRGDELAYHFRGPGKVVLGRNTISDVRRETEADTETSLVRNEEIAVEPLELPSYPVLGQTHPVGARAALAGRENIIMTEWGPWDHASPLVWPLENTGGKHVFALWRFDERPDCTVDGVAQWRLEGAGPDYTLTLSAEEPGVYPYRFTVKSRGFSRELRGALLVAQWELTCFPLPADAAADPVAWQPAANGPGARTIRVHRLDDPAALRRVQAASQPAPDSSPPGNRPWGFIARTRLPWRVGDWQISAMASGGLRVSVDGRNVIDAWRPRRRARRHAGQCSPGEKIVEIIVEHFDSNELTPLSLQILPLDQP